MVSGLHLCRAPQSQDSVPGVSPCAAGKLTYLLAQINIHIHVHIALAIVKTGAIRRVAILLMNSKLCGNNKVLRAERLVQQAMKKKWY